MAQRLQPLSPWRNASSRSNAGKGSACGLAQLLAPAGLHEIYATTHADCAAASGFALAMAHDWQRKPEAALIWVRHDLLQAEAGSLYPPGLLELGLQPASLTLVRAPSVKAALQAGLDAARCSSLSALIVEFWGETRAYDLTASRRLALAAKGSKLRLFLVRHGACVAMSAAETRLSVKALASQALGANAPGRAAFEVTLLRHRAGLAGQMWFMEWNPEAERLEESLPSAPQASSAQPAFRRTG
jgi:protein ImuA